MAQSTGRASAGDLVAKEEVAVSGFGQVVGDDDEFGPELRFHEKRREHRRGAALEMIEGEDPPQRRHGALLSKATDGSPGEKAKPPGVRGLEGAR